MKTLQQAKNEKQAILDELKILSIAPKNETFPEGRKRRKEITANKKKLAKVKEMILYLETEPKPEFIESEAVKLRKRKKLIETSFIKDRTNENFANLTLSQQTKMKQSYYKEMGMPKLNVQLSTLNYLLS